MAALEIEAGIVAVGAIVVAGSALTKVIPIEGAQTFFANLSQITNSIINGNQIQFFPFPQNQFIDKVNEAFVNLVNNANVNLQTINFTQSALVNIFYQKEIAELQKQYNELNGGVIEAKNAISVLNYLRRGDAILSFYNGNFVEWAGGSNASNDKNYYNQLLKAIEDLGIVSKGYLKVESASFGGSHTLDLSQVKFDTKWNTIDKWRQVLQMLESYEKIIDGIKLMLQTYEKAANENIYPVISNIDLPTKPLSPFDIPLPTIPRIREQEQETIHPDIVRDFGIADYLYEQWVERMNKIASMSKVNTASITRTVTISEDENNNNRRRRGNWSKKQTKKLQTIERIKADVALRSEWIKWVIFTFPKKELPNSNAKGKITFVLKNGNSYDIGTYSRGTFSYIVVLMMGTGYGWWSAIPKHKRRLTDPETISYSMPNVSTQMRIKSIAKELTTDGIYYW